MTGRVIDKIGITEKRLDEMLKRFSEISPKDKPYSSTSELIELIAKEKSYSRKELVYMGVHLIATYQRDDDC